MHGQFTSIVIFSGFFAEIGFLATIASRASKAIGRPVVIITTGLSLRSRRKVDPSRNAKNAEKHVSPDEFTPNVIATRRNLRLRQQRLKRPLRLRRRKVATYMSSSCADRHLQCLIIGKRFIPTVPSLPNGLKDALKSSGPVQEGGESRRTGTPYTYYRHMIESQFIHGCFCS
jgi:hypothetical protein